MKQKKIKRNEKEEGLKHDKTCGKFYLLRFGTCGWLGLNKLSSVKLEKLGLRTISRPIDSNAAGERKEKGSGEGGEGKFPSLLPSLGRRKGEHLRQV